MTSKESDATKLAVIATDISYMKGDILSIKTSMQQGYVTKDEFDPIKRIVYGMVATILITVLGAVLTLVLVRYT